MHKLERPPAPACLSRFRHGRDNWRTPSQADRAEIWDCLDEMQQYRCAYCERSIRQNNSAADAHIEHFRQRSKYPQGIFDWKNLFGSCNSPDSCGKHKDDQQYDHKHLIEMDDEDPDDFLRFLPDGQVVPTENLNANQSTRAKKTIRVFNLNGPLRRIREVHVMGYLYDAKEIAEFAEEFDESEWRPLLEERLESIAGHPFETAIRHALQF